LELAISSGVSKFTVTVLGATLNWSAPNSWSAARERLHKVRDGHLGSSGHNTFGYPYVPENDGEPHALSVNDEQAAI
jgi:hypothetical protein